MDNKGKEWMSYTESFNHRNMSKKLKTVVFFQIYFLFTAIKTFWYKKGNLGKSYPI